MMILTFTELSNFRGGGYQPDPTSIGPGRLSKNLADVAEKLSGGEVVQLGELICFLEWWHTHSWMVYNGKSHL